MLHLCVERGGLQPQESCCPALIAAAFGERGFDQFDLVAFDFVVKVDAVIFEVDLAVADAVGIEFSLQSLDFASQSPGELS